jgi:hypothetical protein
MRNAMVMLLLAASLSADPVADSRRFQQEAMKAYRARDYATFLARIRAASDLRPHHPTLLYYLAGGLALNGRGDESLRILDRLADMGMVYAPEKEPDFATVNTAVVAERFRKNAGPIGEAKVAATIPGRGLIPEGLAWDGKRFLVGSVRKGAIYANGKPWITDLPYGVFGLAIQKDILWAAASSVPQFERHKEASAAILKIDRRSGKLLKTIPAPAGNHLFGDLTVAPNGDVYVTDSASPAIYRVRNDVLELFRDGAPFVSLQGITFGGDRLYVADYSNGIYAIDPATRDAALLRVPDSATLLGIDGLYATRRGLIGVQNGTNPHRIVSIGLDGLIVTRVDTLAANLPGMDEPTLGAVTPSGFAFNANSQWNLFGEDGKVKDEAKLQEAKVLRIAE